MSETPASRAATDPPKTSPVAALDAAVALLREAQTGCINHRNGFSGCDSVARLVAELNIDVYAPHQARTYHPETGEYRRCLSCRIGDFLSSLDAEAAI